MSSGEGKKIQVTIKDMTDTHVTVCHQDQVLNLPRLLFPESCVPGMTFVLYSLSEQQQQAQVYKTAKEVLNELLGNSS